MWLFKEIFNSNVSTGKAIITGNISPEIFIVKSSQNTDVARVTYANSITLTPGTVTTKINKNEFEVHALNSNFGDDVRSNLMDRKVKWLEGTDAERWLSACEAMAFMERVHGRPFPQFEWKEKKRCQK